MPASPKKSIAAAPVDMGGVKVKKSTILAAVKALTQVIAKRSANENPLFESSTETMTLLFQLSKIPEQRKSKPVLIPLPHPLYDDKSEVCFICKDPPKKYKELLLEKHPVPGLTKVIGVDKLQRNFKHGNEKRTLADAFDLFLCDRNVISMMPRILGSVFYFKKNKAPIPVDIERSDPTKFVKKAIESTIFRFPKGPCVGVKIGRCSMSPEELALNARAVIAYVMRLLKDNAVVGISIQATDAPALPVWRRAGMPRSSDGSTSAASDTDATGSGTEGAMTSDLETLSEAQSFTEIEDPSMSELDSAAGDMDSSAAESTEMPLLGGLKKKGKKRAAAAVTSSPKSSPKKSATDSMPPPAAKKLKKKKAA